MVFHFAETVIGEINPLRNLGLLQYFFYKNQRFIIYRHYLAHWHYLLSSIPV